MTKSERRNWREKGPPTWAAIWLILVFSIGSYVAAGVGVGRFYDLIVNAVEFWPSVYVIGLGGSYFIRKQGFNEKLRDPGAPPEGA